MESTRSRPVIIAVVVVALAVLAAVGLALARNSGGASEGADDQGAEDEAAELSHVHGLGVDPDDGQLYAGTHYGLIRIAEDGDSTLVGDTVQDFMGFTVTGPGHYLASGHPGEGQDAPGNLGLIESTDGGQTWENVSLSGEADFHALKARHGAVYGYHGGQIMVSQDQQSWDQRASIALADFAVSATDPDVLLATTEDGLVRSTDGGDSFDLVPDAPLLMLVTWPQESQVVGVAPDGIVYVSE
ncbi:MAG: exo-alpha-sialidase, partial [Actinomycetota bacterium]|nr:exo-alpha-sialidase [Actinomycetota bacterium]